MTDPSFTLRTEHAGDDHRIEALNETVFGPGRFVRTAYRLREGVPADRDLSFIAEADGVLVGSVRLTPILIGGKPGILLGPLCVDAGWRGRGCGKALMRAAVEAARIHGHALVLLVGDEPYYWPFGFRRVPPAVLTMPGPVDPARLLVAELVPGAMEGVSGRVEKAR
ncbi:MAG: GNAT family N-acetyltransferase [Bauldia sp.]